MEAPVAELDDDRGRMTRAVSVPPSVAVASELAMVAEAVSACFAARGFRAIKMEWPTDGRKRRAHPTSPAGQHVGLLMCDLGSWERLREVWLLLRQMPMPWVVVITRGT